MDAVAECLKKRHSKLIAVPRTDQYLSRWKGSRIYALGTFSLYGNRKTECHIW